VLAGLLKHSLLLFFMRGLTAQRLVNLGIGGAKKIYALLLQYLV
jgi:hypothetical protein